MKVTKDQAIKLFVALGRKGAGKWEDKRLLKNLQTLHEEEDYKDVEFEDEELQGFLDDCISASEKGEIKLATATKEKVKKGKEVKEPKEKATKSKKEEKKPGVISTIIKCLQKASERKPVTKGQILDTLVEEFPDRNPDSMKATVSAQVPSGLRVEKGVEVSKNDKGYWLPSDQVPQSKGRSLKEKSVKTKTKKVKEVEPEEDDNDENE